MSGINVVTMVTGYDLVYEPLAANSGKRQRLDGPWRARGAPSSDQVPQEGQRVILLAVVVA